MSTEWISAVTALTAVLVSPIITIYVTRAQIQSAQVTTTDQIQAAYDADTRRLRAELASANRQTWINNLRDAIAEHQGLVALLRVDTELKMLDTQERVEKASRMATLVSRVDLMLNPSERDHERLISEMRRMTGMAMNLARGSDDDVQDVQFEVTTIAQAVLKREWERVKAGE